MACDNDFKDYYLRHVSLGKPKMQALVNTMGKLSEVIHHCLKTGEKYRYQGRYRPGDIPEARAGTGNNGETD